MQIIRAAIQGRIHDWLGRSLLPVPNPPVADYVTPRLGECYDLSGEKYLLAKELQWEMEGASGRASGYADTFLGFAWGGTNRLRHDRDRVSVIEEAIAENGIFGMHAQPPVAYFRTNRCAVIRDTKGLVKIVPLDCLKAYADARLIRLPKSESAR